MALPGLKYTQIPNMILDNMEQFSDVELRVILTIARCTIGWHKNTDSISLSQLTERTNRSRPAVSKAVQALEARDFIIIDRDHGNTNRYTLNIEDTQLVNSVNHDQLTQLTGTSKLSLPTKEKKRKEKNISSPPGEVTERNNCSETRETYTSKEWEDAVCAAFHVAGGQIQHVLNQISGCSKTGAWHEYRFEDGKTVTSPQQLYDFAAWYKRKYPSLTKPAKPNVIQSNWYIYLEDVAKQEAQRQHNHTKVIQFTAHKPRPWLVVLPNGQHHYVTSIEERDKLLEDFRNKE